MDLHRFHRPFAALTRKVLSRIQARLMAMSASIPLHAPRLLAQIERHLESTIVNVCGRVMVAELHEARTACLLRGDSPEDRFQDFCSQIEAGRGLQRILGKYPLLRRHLLTAAAREELYYSRLVDRLQHDYEIIRDRLGVGTNHVFTHITPAGDAHAGDQTTIISFSSPGEGPINIVYKPRDLRLDVCFHRFARWLSGEPEYPWPQVVPRGAYGWASWVAYRGCSDTVEVRDYFRRIGQLSAIFYLLDAADMHYENVIAHGAYPVFIDLEGLFQPADQDEGWQANPAASMIARSVITTAVFPDHDHLAGFDGSALGYVDGQLSSSPRLVVVNEGRDDMRFERRRIVVAGQSNQVYLDEKRVSPWRHRDEILAGFTETYERIVRARSQVRKKLRVFGPCRVRYIPRPTAMYAALVDDLRHPALMRSRERAREHLTERLGVGVRTRPGLGVLMQSEIGALWRGEIPSFYAYVGDTSVWSGRGLISRCYFAKAPLLCVQEKLERMGSRDLERQRWLMRLAMGVASAPGSAGEE
ncbi:MAG: type 2 lantipeptide synthetase LanM [Chloroflexi bacterium]|nr:type 2 lantipeptide synthetase LanM [Chloroflexota bacterium]